MSIGSSVYLKCMIAGGVAVLASAIAVTAAAVVAIIWMSRGTDDGTSYGWDPVAFARTPLAFTIFLLSFAAGFYWQYRRIVAH